MDVESMSALKGTPNPRQHANQILRQCAAARLAHLLYSKRALRSRAPPLNPAAHPPVGQSVDIVSIYMNKRYESGQNVSVVNISCLVRCTELF